MVKNKKMSDTEQQLDELRLDLQRTRADFENYRKRIDAEKLAAKELGATTTVLRLLPIIDALERAVSCMPEDLRENVWAAGVAGIEKKLEKLLQEIQLEKITIIPNKTKFNPELHEAISADDTEGEHEIVSEELQAGYRRDGRVIRHAMVRVTHR